MRGKYDVYKSENDNETKFEENNDNNLINIISYNTNNNISNNTNNNITPQIKIDPQNNIINSDNQLINQEVIYKKEEHKNVSQKKIKVNIKMKAEIVLMNYSMIIYTKLIKKQEPMKI